MTSNTGGLRKKILNKSQKVTGLEAKGQNHCDLAGHSQGCISDPDGVVTAFANRG